MDVLPISPKLISKIKKYNLEKKFSKQLKLLKANPKHPSLNTELLEPKHHGIYSFRLDLKFRALFIFRTDKKSIEIIQVTVHYK